MMAGRPSKYKPEYAEQARKICAKFGATNDDLAEVFGVATRTIKNWRNEHPEFHKAMILGKDVADDRVEYSIYHRAIGYSHPEEKAFKTSDDQVVTKTVTKHYPPSEIACMFWLSNRRKDRWKRNVTDDHKGGQQAQLPEEEVARRLASKLDQAKRRQKLKVVNDGPE